MLVDKCIKQIAMRSTTVPQYTILTHGEEYITFEINKNMNSDPHDS